MDRSQLIQAYHEHLSFIYQLVPQMNAQLGQTTSLEFLAEGCKLMEAAIIRMKMFNTQLALIDLEQKQTMPPQVASPQVASPQVAFVQPIAQSGPSNIYKAFNLVRGFDPFDFTKYNQEYHLLQPHYANQDVATQADFYISLANLIIYKEAWLKTEPAKIAFDREIQIKGKNFIEEVIGMYLPDQMISYWYLHFCPAKATLDNITSVAHRYSNHMDVLWQRMYKKYVLKQ